MENLKNIKNPKKIFEGGQKKVYKGTHPKYGEVVLKKGACGTNSSFKRIEREVYVLKNINSKYYPEHYEFISDKTKKEFIIIEEFISLSSLKKVKNEFTKEKDVILLLKHLIKGLSILWDQNIIHRDIKPDNILIRNNYEPVIIDLGIARLLDYKDLTLTLANQGPCTPVYAAPEQIRNNKDIIGIRTDFFLLGILIYELLLGFHPFKPSKINNKNTITDNILNGNFYNLENTDLSKSSKDLIKKLLNPKPYLRFRNKKLLIKYISKNWGDL